MNKEKQIEEAARLEFGNNFMHIEHGFVSYRSKLSGREKLAKLPDYLHDHNAIQRLVDGLGNPSDFCSDYHKFLDELDQMIYALHYDVAIDEIFISTDYYLQATCPQKLEAILKAHSVWVEEEL